VVLAKKRTKVPLCLRSDVVHEEAGLHVPYQWKNTAVCIRCAQSETDWVSLACALLDGSPP
jgi:hypothetical protein